MPTSAGDAGCGSGSSLAVRGACLFGFSNNMLNISLNAQAVGVEFLYRRSIMGTFHGMWSVGAVIGGVIGAVAAPVGIAPLPHFGAIFLLSILTLVMLRTAIMPRDVRSAAQKKEKASIRPDLYIILLASSPSAALPRKGLSMTGALSISLRSCRCRKVWCAWATSPA